MKRAKSGRRGRPVPVVTPAGATDTVVVPVLPPRNPYQQLARSRKAGAHDVDARKRRRIEAREMQRKLHED